MVHLLDTVVSYTSPTGKTEKMSMKDLLSQARYTVLYFYPKDNTPGCTIEAREFSVMKKKFEKEHAQIIGVSKDTSNSHCRFQENEDLTIGLISDKERILPAYFGSQGIKKFMGKEYLAVLRNTYLLDNDGTVLYKWEEVEPIGHANEVLTHIKSLSL